jgi:hypothetical protein
MSSDGHDDDFAGSVDVVNVERKNAQHKLPNVRGGTLPTQLVLGDQVREALAGSPGAIVP